MKLTRIEENVVTEHVIDLIDRGVPPRLADVADMANCLRAERGLGQVGLNWHSAFVKRYPELKMRFSGKYDYKRALYENPDNVRAWFELVSNIKAKHGVLDDAWNFDETGFMIGQICTGMVVTASERRSRPKAVHSGNREWATANAGINGQAIPPFLILKAHHHLSSWYKDDDIPQD
jgi:hypothetical protein